MHFDLAKYFRNVYLAEANELPKGKWQKLSKDELADYEGDIQIMGELMMLQEKLEEVQIMK